MFDYEERHPEQSRQRQSIENKIKKTMPKSVESSPQTLQRKPLSPSAQYSLQCFMAPGESMRGLDERSAAAFAQEGTAVVQRNETGIPDDMKERFENLSGFSFDDVRVHYNSDKPAQLKALAFTQGNQVYVGPGQEKHLTHELGHVVQQKQGIVKPTQKRGGLLINDDSILEEQAEKQLVSKRPVQMKAANVIQCASLKQDCLNVAGEDHSVSNNRRSIEQIYAKTVGLEKYWKENEFHINEDDKSPYADPFELRMSQNFILIRDYCQLILSDFLNLNINELINRLRNGEEISEEDDKNLTSFIEQGILSFNDAMKVNVNNVLINVENMNDGKDAYGIADEEKVKYDRISQVILRLVHLINRFRALYYSGTDDESSNGGDIFLSCISTMTELYKIFKKINLGEYNEVVLLRSVAMHQTANERKDVPGLWKIGNNHVGDIMREHSREIEYNLLTMEEFESGLSEFQCNINSIQSQLVNEFIRKGLVPQGQSALESMYDLFME